MLLEKITPRKTISLGCHARLYANSALSITMEVQGTDAQYHLTYTEADLREMLTIIEDRKAEINESMTKECIVCGQAMKGETTVDFEGWSTHRDCLGPYDMQVLHPKTGEYVYLRGFENETEAENLIKEDYPETKFYNIKKVRGT